MRRLPFAALTLTGLAVLLLVAAPAQALFHFAHISEIMASYDNDDTVQFVEVEMEAGSQNVIANGVIAVFDFDGTYLTDLIVFPSNVANSGAGVTFIVGTSSFQTASGLTPDFVAGSADLPTGGGMVCFGGGGGFVPQNPPVWDRTLVETYVDCLAYGFYTGVTKTASGNPTPLLPEGHSLTRVSDTNDNETDFDCGDPATPTNNGGASVNMNATIVECPEPALASSLVAGIGMLVWLRRRGHRRR